MTDPADDLPVTDSDRDKVVERLGDHVGTGRLTLAEFEDRVSTALAARTGAELERTTADLPAVPVSEPRRPKPRRWIVSMLGGSTARGRWRVAEQLRTVAAFGGSDIDLRSAEFDGEQINITSFALFGGDDIYLPDTVDVQLSGWALFGGNGVHGGARRPRRGAPVARVRMLSLFGGTDVYRLPAEAADLPLRDARRLAKKSPGQLSA